jgi:hypothetical protein
MPQIVTYRSDDAPDAERWLSCFRTTKPLPMVFRGRTKEIVIATANSWWAGEIAREAARRERAAKMLAGRES